MRFLTRTNPVNDYKSIARQIFVWNGWIVLPAILVTKLGGSVLTNIVVFQYDPDVGEEIFSIDDAIFVWGNISLAWLICLALFLFYYIEWKRPINPKISKGLWYASILLNLSAIIATTPVVGVALRTIFEVLFLDFWGSLGYLRYSIHYDMEHGTFEVFSLLLTSAGWVSVLVLYGSAIVTAYRSIMALRHLTRDL